MRGWMNVVVKERNDGLSPLGVGYCKQLIKMKMVRTDHDRF